MNFKRLVGLRYGAFMRLVIVFGVAVDAVLLLLYFMVPWMAL